MGQPTDHGPTRGGLVLNISRREAVHLWTETPRRTSVGKRVVDAPYASPFLLYNPLKSRGCMQLNVVSKADNELEIEVHGENETLLNPIKQALLNDKDV